MNLTKRDLADLRKQNSHLPKSEFELAIACFTDDHACIKKILETGTNPNPRFHNGSVLDATPLILSAWNANVEAVSLLLEARADPTLQTRSEVGGAGGRDALSKAIESAGDQQRVLEIVKMLLKHGADPNTEDSNGRVPLVFAAQRGDIDLIETLVSAGANPLQSPSGPLFHYASGVKCIEWFLKRGWNADACGKDLRTSLLGASENGDEELIEFFLKKGADTKHRDIDGVSCLSFACRYATRTRFPKEDERAMRVITRLLAAGADINNKDNHGKSPLDYAKLARNPAVADFLKVNGAKTGKQIRTR